MRNIVALFVLAPAFAFTTAEARIVTLEPDDYAAGSDISNVGEGARLYSFSNLSGSVTRTAVYAQSNPLCITDPTRCDASTGTMGFGSSAEAGALYGDWAHFFEAASCFRWQNIGGPGSPCTYDPFHAMLIEFDRPTDFVELSGAFLSDTPAFSAYDADFNFLGGCAYGDGLNCVGVTTIRPGFDYSLRTVTLNTPTASVAYIIAGGTSGNSSLDNLRYSVPEPGTLALFALGALGLGMRRRRALARSA